MTSPFKVSRLLVSITIGIFIVVIAIGYIVSVRQASEAITINTEGQPTIGDPNAKVRVVVFEEPKCFNCKQFNNSIFPKIKRDFIDTDQVLYTVITVSFLPSSLPAADALLCVYHQGAKPNPDLFFSYLDFIYQNQPPEKEDWATDDKLIEMAHLANPGIQLRQLRVCTDAQTHREQIVRNTEYGRRIMHGHITTPTLYVDGVLIPKLTYAKVSKAIRRALSAKGELP